MASDDDRTVPNQAANKSKAEGERWQSEPDTVERRDRERPSGDAGAEGGGITNRPLSEEREHQESLPDRGRSRPGAHAGHGRSQTDDEEER